MSILMKNNNMINKYNINVLPINNKEEYNFNRLKYIPYFFIIYIDVRLIQYTNLGQKLGCDLYTSTYGKS